MRLFSEDKEFMERTIDNHMVIKNRTGKYNHGINCEILNFYGKSNSFIPKQSTLVNITMVNNMDMLLSIVEKETISK